MKYTGRKGWQASYKDTWCLDSTLSPIIAAGLKKYIEVIKRNNNCAGIPMLDHFECDDTGNIKDWGKCQQEWYDILDKMLYAFEDNEPDILKYNLNWDRIQSPSDNPKYANARVKFVQTNKEGSEQYERDMRDWEKRRLEGLELFGKYFINLWW